MVITVLSDDESIPFIDFESMFKVQFTPQDIDALREALRDMKKPVNVKLFTAKTDCFTCIETEKLLRIIAENSPSTNNRNVVDLEIFYREDNIDVFAKYGVDRVPTIKLLEGTITYLGMPAGEEIRSFIETLIRISNEDPGLPRDIQEQVSKIDRDIVIEVIVTPPCPYCPYVALTANMFAYTNKLLGPGTIKSVVVEAYENPDIADRYATTMVPLVAINGIAVSEGPMDEYGLLEVLKRIALA